jgi:predicted O-methyltransferase YrrM
MKQVFYNLFEKLFGPFFRAIQRTLPQRTQLLGIHDLITQSAFQDSAEFAKLNFTKAMIFDRREDLWDHCISKRTSRSHKLIFTEFGVFNGTSINYFARKCPHAELYGFDSFEGLEEDWHGFRLLKHSFDRHGLIPKCEENVELIKGWFVDSVPEFLNRLKARQIDIVHLDADTYTPTAFVLESIKKNMQTGTIIIFDEFFGYTNYQAHEIKAWLEFVERNHIQFEYIGYTEMQVAVQIL